MSRYSDLLQTAALQLAGRSFSGKCWTQLPRHQTATTRPGKRLFIFTDLKPAVIYQTDIRPAKMWRKGHDTQKRAAVLLRAPLLNVCLHQLWPQRTSSCWTATDGNMHFAFKSCLLPVFCFWSSFPSTLSHNWNDKQLPFKTICFKW